ncbi:MAG: haloacid dehalogenase-like hydrolase [Bacteroidales bacterium]|nr:haloacid dehalogenase-like hydrolase [Bacteroidales bacterium]
MKKKILSLPLLLGILFVTLSFNNPKTENALKNSLDRLNWSERNYSTLNQMINEYGIGGKYHEEGKTPYIVLDWDQTCAHFDVEEALMRYQLFNLHFKMTKDQFKNILKDTINGVFQLSENFNKINLSDLNSDLITEYNFLQDNYVGFHGKMALDEIMSTPQYKDFIVKFLFLADGYFDTPGIGMDHIFLWELYLFTGFSIDEVKSMAKEAVSFELANQIGKQTLHSPSGLKTRTGDITCSFNSGLRVFSEMQNLISTCRGHGIDAYIVSASYKPVVEVFSGIGNFGYNFEPDHVIGMELEIGADGKILPEYKKGWIKTFGQGKVEAINKKIKSLPGKNHDPLFAAGDSDGDIEMLTKFPGMKLALIWNRVKGGEIGKLCKKAVDEMEIPNPRFILQGRNENIGMAIPSSETILLGKTQPELLHQ